VNELCITALAPASIFLGRITDVRFADDIVPREYGICLAAPKLSRRLLRNASVTMAFLADDRRRSRRSRPSNPAFFVSVAQVPRKSRTGSPFSSEEKIFGLLLFAQIGHKETAFFRERHYAAFLVFWFRQSRASQCCSADPPARSTVASAMAHPALDAACLQSREAFALPGLLRQKGLSISAVFHESSCGNGNAG